MKRLIAIMVILIFFVSFVNLVNSNKSTILIEILSGEKNLIDYLKVNDIYYKQESNLLYLKISQNKLNSLMSKFGDSIKILNGVDVRNFWIYSSDPYSIKVLIDAYGLSEMLSKGYDGHNRTIIIVDPYGDPNIIENLNKFDDIYGFPDANLMTIYPLGKPLIQNFSWAVETDLDVEIAHAAAPRANILLVISPSDNSTNMEFLLKYVIDHYNDSIVSMSWGAPELMIYNPYFHEIFERSVNKNITFVAASGDEYEVQYPASDPYVLSVGGTTLFLNNGIYYKEYPWTLAGGGFSELFKRPIWQIAPGINNSKYRGVPDISMDANPQTGTYIYSGTLIPIGGTSMASPFIAGFIADLESKYNINLGFFTPELYYYYFKNKNEYFNKIYLGYNPIDGWYPQVGLGSLKMNNWTLNKNSFGINVYAGNYSNVKYVEMEFRPQKNYIDYNINELKIELVSNNGSIGNIFFGNNCSDYIFYNNKIIWNKSIDLNIGTLNYLSFNFENNQTLIKINHYSFILNLKLRNFSILFNASSIGPTSFYTTLGPYEIRNIKIYSNTTEKPYKIYSMKWPSVSTYSANEIPFMEDDFIFGSLNTENENVLWPREFNYTDIGTLNLNINSQIYIVGIGTKDDPYILSGLYINSTKIGIIYKGSSYILLYHSIIKSLIGIFTIFGNFYIIDDKIISQIPYISIFSFIYLQNTTIISNISGFQSFSYIFLDNSYPIIYEIQFSSFIDMWYIEYMFIFIFAILLILGKRKKFI
ncbi:MAG: S53 family peptidase [Thermoplasmata archaeon]